MRFFSIKVLEGKYFNKNTKWSIFQKLGEFRKEGVIVPSPMDIIVFIIIANISFLIAQESKIETTCFIRDYFFDLRSVKPIPTSP